MPVKRGTALRALKERSLSWNDVPRRWNSTSLPAVQEKNVKFAPESPIQRLVTLRTLDQLVTTIARSSAPSVLNSLSSMRALSTPWLSLKDPELAALGAATSRKHTEDGAGGIDGDVLTEAQLEELMRPRYMSESYTTFDLPLASDKSLFERYVDTTGSPRMGMLLEHLDSLAGAVAYKHCLPSSSLSQSGDPVVSFNEASARAGLYIATASADRLDMLGDLGTGNARDIRFSGFVATTGKSSMEVVVRMQGSKTSPQKAEVSSSREIPEQWETLLLGRFAMVCRDSRTSKAKAIPALIVETDEEKALWRIGQRHRERQKENAMMALDKVPPTSQEAEELHGLMLKVGDDTQLDTYKGEKVVPMADTEIQSVQLMFPQDRNLHGKVFGGILIRSAFELCSTNAALFASKPMRFLALDQITFRLPVPIGAVLLLTSKIVKTTRPTQGAISDEEAKVHIMVRAEVEDVKTGLREETNVFFFTMAKEDHEPLGKTVVPHTYLEAMHYLEGKRRLGLGDEMRSLYNGGIQR